MTDSVRSNQLAMGAADRVAALRYAVKCATETDSTMALVPVSMARAAAADIERLQGIDRGTTHADGCWGWGPKHYDCAAAEIERLQLELRLAVSARDYANDLLDRERQRAAHELPVGRKSDKFDLAFEIMRQLEAENIETMQSCQFGYVMRITREGTLPTLSDIPSAWYRGVQIAGPPDDPTEYDVEMSYGDEQPEGDGWIPLYRRSASASIGHKLSNGQCEYCPECNALWYHHANCNLLDASAQPPAYNGPFRSGRSVRY